MDFEEDVQKARQYCMGVVSQLDTLIYFLSIINSGLAMRVIIWSEHS
jgi:hypothetical protein